VAARQRVATAARRNGKFAMCAGMFAPLSDLVSEGHQVFNVGADVIALGAYVKQRIEFVRDQIDTLPATFKSAAQTPYA
jgi:hypothetical protein